MARKVRFPAIFAHMSTLYFFCVTSQDARIASCATISGHDAVGRSSFVHISLRRISLQIVVAVIRRRTHDIAAPHHKQ